MSRRRSISDYRYPLPHETDVLLVPIKSGVKPVRRRGRVRGSVAPPPPPRPYVRERVPRPPRPRTTRPPATCTVAYGPHDAIADDGSRRAVPSLRLSGRWLEALGFVVGGQVRIEVQDGALRLTPLPADAEGAPPSGGVKP